MTFMNFSSHGTQDIYPTFLQRYWHFDASKRALISAVAGSGRFAAARSSDITPT